MAPFVECAKIKPFHYLVHWVKYIMVQTVYYVFEVKQIAHCNAVNHENMLFQWLAKNIKFEIKFVIWTENYTK